jgi:hypothetical protein
LNLQVLSIQANPLGGWGSIEIPPTLKTLNAGQTGTTSFTIDMKNLEILNLNANNLSTLGTLPNTLKELLITGSTFVIFTNVLPPALIALNIAGSSNLQDITSPFPSTIKTLYAYSCKLPQSKVNSTLIEIDSFATSNGTLFIYGQNPAAPPSGAGALAKTNLQGRGWSVATDV